MMSGRMLNDPTDIFSEPGCPESGMSGPKVSHQNEDRAEDSPALKNGVRRRAGPIRFTGIYYSSILTKEVILRSLPQIYRKLQPSVFLHSKKNIANTRHTCLKKCFPGKQSKRNFLQIQFLGLSFDQ